ncbi:hypothetical protein RND81_13G196700 [Saponaria officinalis]|uniref:Uncharacterized protein n=1 Tax=Saponaria officinalis TaxID=3572 RepID=A0AAW1H2Z1_SAPOF
MTSGFSKFSRFNRLRKPRKLRKLPGCCTSSLPSGDCIISLCYPPGSKLMAFVEKSKVNNFFIPKNLAKDLPIHEIWEIQTCYKKDLKNAKIKLTEEWKRLLALCMLNVTREKACKNMTTELEKHGKFIYNLDERNYLQFVVGVFLRYRFD